MHHARHTTAIVVEIHRARAVFQRIRRAITVAVIAERRQQWRAVRADGGIPPKETHRHPNQIQTCFTRRGRIRQSLTLRRR